MSDISHTTPDDLEPSWEQDLFSATARVMRRVAEAKARTEELKAQVEQKERENQVSEEKRQAQERFSQLASDTTVYVEYGNLMGVPDPKKVEQLHTFLEQLGLKNMNIRFRTAAERVDFMLRQRYVAVNFEKGAFISSSTCYNYVPVPQEEFMHVKRGAHAAKKFGF